MVQRADLITQLTNKNDIFSDFMNDFSPHPITGDVVRIRNENSIRQSIKNLILTNIGERFFNPNVGSNVYRMLFEPLDSVTLDDLNYFIKLTIDNNEPRANLLSVSILPITDENSISLNIVYSIINSSAPQSLNVLIRRVH